MTTDIVEVEHFVHVTGYYRRFVPEFASRAAPLTKLLRKGVVWYWGAPQEEALADLKDGLARRNLLAYPDFSKPIRLVTDASKMGLEAPLTQAQDKGSS